MQPTFDTPRDWAIDLAVCAALGVFLGFLGPFGSYDNDGAPARIAYWAFMSLAGGVTFGVLLRRLRPLAVRAALPAWTWLPAAVALGSLLPSTLSRHVALALWPFLERVSLADWYAEGAVVSLVTVCGYVALRVRLAPQPQAAGREGAPAPLRRLPARFGPDLLCLQMEDHYRRIHTLRGSDLVHMTFGQAMGELGGLEGLQVHRSWWVARRAVEEAVQDGRKLRLRLVNGLEVPVARSAVARLRAAGWIAGAEGVPQEGGRPS